MLSVEAIEKSYGRKRVLSGASFTCKKGGCAAIVGENGSGKSTLLRVLAGVIRPDAGSASWNGRELLSDAAYRREKVAYVPQGTPLMGELTALDNLLLWYSRRELEKSLESGVLSELRVAEFLKTPANRLSGGMKKRLSIGCAMAKDPEVLLLDEPTASLDLTAKEDILGYFMSFRRKGGAVVLVTHDAEEIALSSECYLLKNGVLTKYDYDGDTRRLVGSFRD